MLALGCLATPARAHVGPPFPIVEDQRVGPYVVAVWTHPDIGTGTFLVILDPPRGGTLPEGTTVEVGVQPVSGRLPEACYPAERQPNQDHEQYLAQVQFDAQEMWRVRVLVQGPRGGGEVKAEVEPTPPGYGRWDFLIYAFPFVFLAAFIVYGVVRRRLARAQPAGDDERAARPANGVRDMPVARDSALPGETAAS
jgi:hypothetical protein